MDQFYLKKNQDWANKTKYGYVEGNTKNLLNRLRSSTEEHSELSDFIGIFLFKKTNKYKLHYKEIDKLVSLIGSSIKKIEIIENIYDIKLSLFRKLNDYLVVSKTKRSNEFIYNNGIPLLLGVLREEFPLLGLKLVKEYSKKELLLINHSIKEFYKKEQENDSQMFLKLNEKSKLIDSRIDICQQPEKDEYKWFERKYQGSIIEYGVKTLTSDHKFYLELATGGGKSYIIYKILSRLKPQVILIFSPRKNINKQNCKLKYLSILNYDYLVYNCSNGDDFTTFKEKCRKENKKMLIVACPQGSNKKVYNLIHNNNLNNIFIWFDEAHHTIEKWVDKVDNIYTKFFLEENERIDNKIFTSASPDKDYVQQYPRIFGEIYSPIKVKELIQLGWLCQINCKILEFDILNFNLLVWILEGFVQNNKSFGFSFHSRDNNAFNLFYQHYQLYNSNETGIKPFLLIHDAGLNKNNKDKLKNISLEYNFRDVSHFENKKELPDKYPKNMAYVVKQFDMGYDFEELDYIVITDPKVSFKDVIQCIGRGTRSDKKGPHGTNLNKELLLMLPTYIKEDNNDYKNIIEVLRYLILDLNMDIEKILINPLNSSESKESQGLEYKGTKKNSSKLLDLLYSNNVLNRVNTRTLNKFCIKYGIKTEQDYYKFKELNPSLSLKDNLYEYTGFYWKNVVDPNNELYYSSKLECIKSKEKLIYDQEQRLTEESYDELLGDIQDNGWIEINKHDPKVPPYRDLDKYYF